MTASIERQKVESIKLAVLEMMQAFTDGINRAKIRDLYWFRQKPHWREFDDDVLYVVLCELIDNHYVTKHGDKYYLTSKDF